MIGGEHEDFYDPDFCIYNDVFLFEPNGELEIYGYPPEIFPPTDFHTATLTANAIWIIGGLGYYDDRQPGTTLVHRLNTQTLEIDKLSTDGDLPGWVFNHRATLLDQERIQISGGERQGDTIVPNKRIHILDTSTHTLGVLF